MSYEEQIKFFPVSPASYTKRAIEDPWTLAGLRRIVAPQHPKRIGIVIASGFLENLNFNGTDAFERAMGMDGLAIWIPSHTSYPPVQPHGPREYVRDDFASVTKFTELHALLKEGLINGTEIQLVRKVFAIGCEIEQAIYPTNGEEDVTVHLETKWIRVPIDDSERFPGQQKKSRRK